MSAAKRHFEELLRQLPDDCSLADIQYHAYKFARAERQVKNPTRTDVLLLAPKEKFRVVRVDTFPFPPEDHLIGDFDALNAACNAATAKGGVMHVCHVYDDCGELVFSAGKW